jgi:hypothetical protein
MSRLGGLAARARRRPALLFGSQGQARRFCVSVEQLAWASTSGRDLPRRRLPHNYLLYFSIEATSHQTLRLYSDST